MKKYLISLGIILLLVLGFLPGRALANPTGLQIAPVTFNFDVNPGESQTGKVTITNRTDENLDYVMEIELFQNSSEVGEPTFEAVKPESGVSTLADWIKFDKDSGTLAPKGSQDINFTVTPPVGADPGGHYGAIFARQVLKTPEGQNQVAIAARVGSLVLVSIPGEVTKGAQVIEFQAPKFVWKGPINFKMRVQNTGSVHYDSTATASIKNLLGQTTSFELGTHTVLPKNIRIFEKTWEKKYPFGYYRITPTATDGDNQIISGATVGLIAIPLVIVIPALVGLIVFIWIIIYFKRHVRIVK